MTNVIMVVAPAEFRDEEYTVPRRVLEDAGHHISVASVHAGPILGRFGTRAQSDLALCDADASDFGCVVFVGGGGSQVFFDDSCAHHIAHSIYDQGGLVCAICIAPTTLARAGMLKGVRATAFSSALPALAEGGAVVVKEGVVVDGRIVTADGPESAEEFGRCIVELLEGQEPDGEETA